jgi:hypothetical protein
MRTPFRTAVALVVVLLGAGGCGASGDGPTQSPAPGSPTPTTPSPASPNSAASPSPPGGAVALPDDLRSRPAVAAAIADTAARQGVDPAAVVIAAWSPVTWTDGSLGCPVEGMAYTQALVEGELLMLRVGTGLYQYHGPTGGPFTYCAKPTAAYTVSG